MLGNLKFEPRLSCMAGIGAADVDAAETRRVCSALLDSIGRDVSKPLAVILADSAALRYRDSIAAGTVEAEMIDAIQAEAARIDGFVSILLDMARLESGCVEPRIATVAVKDVVRKAINDAARALRERRVDVRIPTDLRPLQTDSAMLRRVVSILIQNAASQSPPASTIGVHAGRDRRAIRIQVLDEGEGIPTTELAGLFNQFHLPCANDETRFSSGMHLAVCRGYIEALGGTISGSNRTDGGGAVFTITFPIST